MLSLRDESLRDFLESVGSKTPAPGGGAVASAAGALAAALARMVVAYSLGKKDLEDHQPTLSRAGAVLSRTADLLLELADEDAAAYGLVNELSKLPETDSRRMREWGPAVQASVDVPRAVVGACCDLLRLLEMLRPISNPRLRSDLAIAAVLAEAAARSGAWNVRVNLDLVSSGAERAEVEAEITRLLDEAARRRETLERECA